MIRIAHISDLHFSRFSLNPLQFLSKEWLGNCNLLLNRSKDYLNERPFSLLPTFKEKGITHVLISGDLTTTSNESEYKIAKEFVEALKQEGMQVFAIPGNHDHYTKRSDRTKRFYRYFPSPKGSPFSLSQHGVCSLPLFPGWHLVMLDTALATPLASSNGLFSPVIEKNLIQVLNAIPSEDKVIMMNHFPFFDHDTPRRRLIRSQALRALMGTTAIYLYGHTHRHTIADLRPNSQPLLLNSGSTGHRNGSWNQLDLDETTLTLTPYRWQEGWQEEKTQTFTFETKAWYHQGLRFKCTGCGKCCTGAGFVWLEEEDVKNISARLELTEDAFYKQYTRQLGFDTSLIEDPVTTDCIFLEDKKFCKIYDARPKQCRTFPWWKGNLENPQAWKEAKERCEGIDHPEAPLISLPEIEKNLE